MYVKRNKMDETESLGDAEMRFVTVNGQTMMLEGDLGSMNVTNDLLNQMFLGNGEKQADDCVTLNGVPCVNDLQCVNSDTRLEITVQGENNELQVIQIGMEEAKALGLYLPPEENGEDATGSQPCILNGDGIESQEAISIVRIGNSDDDNMKPDLTSNVKLESMPLLDLDGSDKEASALSPSDEPQLNGATDCANHFEFAACDEPFSLNAVKSEIPVQEDSSSDNFPAIGHLEGFQIPTAEDGTHIPATVNAKMADGSYRMLTLIPQIQNGSVTYTIQFANLESEENYSELFDQQDFNDDIVSNGIEASDKNVKQTKKSIIAEFLNSVHPRRNEKGKNGLLDHTEPVVEDTDKADNSVNFTNLSLNQSISECNNRNNIAVPGAFNTDDFSVTYTHQTPIQTKIDSIIEENENVISKCKKMRYGKKYKEMDLDTSGGMMENINSVTRNNVVRAKKVKFKDRPFMKQINSEITEQKKLKMSLLKQNNEQLQAVQLNAFESSNKKLDNVKFSANKNMISHINLNCRLEYPNLKAIDDVSPSLSYLKIKNQTATKQPYFNVLPTPKDKTVPPPRQILPLNCDLQQAKNLISLQKFLETQKFQLKIQPVSSNTTKLTTIRPKPSLGEQLKVLQDLGITAPVINNEKPVTSNSSPYIAQPSQSSSKSYQESSDKLQTTNAKDVLLSEGKMNFHKFLKPISSEPELDIEKDSTSSFCGKNGEIFIKNNPDYFSSKVKDERADEHPLGSSENPIQLVQTGHTFHSRQPLSETQLRQIASILQKQKFDSPNVKKNSIFDPKTNTRIVYRVVYPEDVELKKLDDNSVENGQKKKRGRHRTKPLLEEGEILKQPCPVPNGPRGPGRPKSKKNLANTQDEDCIEDEVEEATPKKKIPRTRSGRLSRPPRYMVKDYKRLHNSDIAEKNANSNYESDGGYSDFQAGKETVKERVEKVPEVETNLLPGLRPQQRSKRNFKPEYRCPTCQKIYLGRTRMMWHLSKFPDHCSVEKYEEIYYNKRTETKVRRAARRLNLGYATGKVMQILSSMPKDELTSLCGPLLADALSTWDFLLLRVNLIKDDTKGEVDALLHELAVLLEKLTKIAEDLLFPVFTRETEKENDYVEIDKMEIAIALGLPTGVYKINNDNLNLLRLPMKNMQHEKPQKEVEPERERNEETEALFTSQVDEKAKEQPSFLEKTDAWGERKTDGKNVDNDPFWMESKVSSSSGTWHVPEESSVKTLATKFEPNLSTKLLESSNDSIDDSKYEEPVPVIDLDSNSKDIEHSNSSENLDESNEISLGKDQLDAPGSIEGKNNENAEKIPTQLWNEASVVEKVSPELWNENSNITAEKAPPQLWNEDSNITAEKTTPQLWNDNADITQLGEKVWNEAASRNDKPTSLWNESSDIAPVLEKTTQLWNENSNITPAVEKTSPSLWNENSNLTPSEKVNETNSEFQDSFLAVPYSSEFLGNENSGFLTDNISLIDGKDEKSKADSSKDGNAERGGNFMRIWDTSKNEEWGKDDAEILSGALHDRMPGLRTTNRLTSTPETNGTIAFDIPNRRNSISDFSNINLEPSSLDMVLPPAKTLIKERTKTDGLEKIDGSFDIKETVPFLEGSDNFKIKNWNPNSTKPDFSTSNVNSEDLMKMALESLTSQHDVINVPAASFDSAMGILNTNQETGNLNLFTTGETDGLDFNLPLPEHLLRTNFTTNNNFTNANFQTTCTSNFSNSVSPTFMSTTNNIFGTTSTNSIKFDQYDTNFVDKKAKLEDEVIEFFDPKNTFTSYENCNLNETNNMTNFSFVSTSSHSDQYSVTQCLNDSIMSAFVPENDQKPKKKGKGRVKKSNKVTESKSQVRTQKIKKTKSKKVVDYPKSSSIESIINEAIFDSCVQQASTGKLQIKDSSPSGSSVIANGTDNYALPIIPESLDEVGNLDFLNQD